VHWHFTLHYRKSSIAERMLYRLCLAGRESKGESNGELASYAARLPEGLVGKIRGRGGALEREFSVERRSSHTRLPHT